MQDTPTKGNERIIKLVWIRNPSGAARKVLVPLVEGNDYETFVGRARRRLGVPEASDIKLKDPATGLVDSITHLLEMDEFVILDVDIPKVAALPPAVPPPPSSTESAPGSTINTPNVSAGNRLSSIDVPKPQPNGGSSSLESNFRRVAIKSDTVQENPVAGQDVQVIMTNGVGVSSSGGGSSLPDAQTMRQDTKRLVSRLRKMDRCLLNPRSKLMQYWDFCTLSALLFTATITPYEVCLMWEEVTFNDGIKVWLTPLFVLNWIVNLIFMVDICFNFFLPFKESQKKGGGTVKSHAKIFRNYAFGWFPIDFVSVIPVDNIMMLIDVSQLSGASVLGAIRMLRLLRLVKLGRILRASRIFSRWENSISTPYPQQSLIFWFLIVIFTLHFLACMLGLLAQLMMPPRTMELSIAVQTQIDAGDLSCYGCTPETPISADSICKSRCLTPCEVQKLAELRSGHSPYSDRIEQEYILIKNEEAWPCRYAQNGQIRPMPTYNGELYMAALYVAMIQLGGGIGSIVPMNFLEYIFFFVAIFAGSVLWAMVVGTICATLSTGDPHTNAFKTNMDNLNYFLDDMQIPYHLRIRAREYLRNSRDLIKKSSYNELIHTMSPVLRADIVTSMSAKTLEPVWYLGECEQMARVELAVRLTRHGFPSREKVSSVKLSILMRGVAARCGNILTPSSHWGDDFIVSAPALRDVRPANSLTYVEVVCLSRDDLFGVLNNFPKSSSVIRQAAMKVAMRRAVVIISNYMRLRSANRGDAASSMSPGFRSLTAAFGHADAAPADPTTILRMVTGSSLKDVIDGELVEAVDNEPEDPIAEMRRELGEIKEHLDIRRELRLIQTDIAKVQRVQQDMTELKVMVKTLLDDRRQAPGMQTEQSDARPMVEDTVAPRTPLTPRPTLESEQVQNEVST